MTTLFQFFRDLFEFIRYQDIQNLIENPDDPIPYRLHDE